MPRDDDNSQRRDYRPPDQLAPPQPDRSWRDNGQHHQDIPADDLSFEPAGFRHVPDYVPDITPDDPPDLPEPDPPSPAQEATAPDVLPQELEIVPPTLEPDEVIDPEDEAEMPRQWRPTFMEQDDRTGPIGDLRAIPRPPDPHTSLDMDGLTVQERYEILLQTIELYQIDWKLWRVRAHEESGKLQAILIPRQGGLSAREAYDRDQLLIVTVDTEGNTDIREPQRRRGRGLRFWGGSRE